MKKLFAAFFAILFCSCSVVEEAAKYDVDLDKTSPVESVFSDYQYVKLETQKECLVSKIQKIELLPYGIFILDKDRILRFSSNGKFLSKIEKRGRGAEEYFQVDDFSVQDSLAFVLCRSSKAINVYTFDGHFVKKISVDDWFAHMSFCGKDTLVLSAENANNSQKNFVFLNVKTGDKIDEFDKFDENENMLFPGCSPFSGKTSTGLFAVHPFDYHVYKLEKDGLSSYCQFDFLKHNLPENISSMSFYDAHMKTQTESVVKHLGLYCEVNGNRYLTLKMFSPHGGISPYVCKICRNGNTVVVKLNEHCSSRFPYVSAPLAMSKDCLVSALSAEDIIGIEERHNLNAFKKQGLKKSDNYVVFFNRLK